MHWEACSFCAKLSARRGRGSRAMKTRRRFGTVRAVLGLAFLLGVTAAFAQGTQGAAQPAQSAPPAQAAPPEQKIYKNEQLDQMMAPVALYPDSVLSQLLMACTY